MLWALPLAGGLLVAIPLCVATANPRFGEWLRRHKVAAIPEEITILPLPAPSWPLTFTDPAPDRPTPKR